MKNGRIVLKSIAIIACVVISVLIVILVVPFVGISIDDNVFHVAVEGVLLNNFVVPVIVTFRVILVVMVILVVTVVLVVVFHDVFVINCIIYADGNDMIIFVVVVVVVVTVVTVASFHGFFVFDTIVYDNVCDFVSVVAVAFVFVVCVSVHGVFIIVGVVIDTVAVCPKKFSCIMFQLLALTLTVYCFVIWAVAVLFFSCSFWPSVMIFFLLLKMCKLQQIFWKKLRTLTYR